MLNSHIIKNHLLGGYIAYIGPEQHRRSHLDVCSQCLTSCVLSGRASVAQDCTPSIALRFAEIGGWINALGCFIVFLKQF